MGQQRCNLHSNETFIRADEAGLVRAIARWCESLHGFGTIQDALAELCRGLDITAAMLVRASRNPQGKTRFLVHDALDQNGRVCPLQRSYARSFLGPYFDKMRPVSIWFKSHVDVEIDPALEAFQKQRQFTELAVIPMATNEKHVDLLELHFQNHAEQGAYMALNMIAATLVNTWNHRSPGVMTRNLGSVPKCLPRQASQPPILSIENPARLSRAEYRICVLMSQGVTKSRLREELGISSSTLRTHLRQIFLKTGLADQTELLHHLLNNTPSSSADLMAKSA